MESYFHSSQYVVLNLKITHYDKMSCDLGTTEDRLPFLPYSHSYLIFSFITSAASSQYSRLGIFSLLNLLTKYFWKGSLAIPLIPGFHHCRLEHHTSVSSFGSSPSHLPTDIRIYSVSKYWDCLHLCIFCRTKAGIAQMLKVSTDFQSLKI